MDAAPLLWNDTDRQRYYELGRWAIGLTDEDLADQDLLHESLQAQAKKLIAESGEYFPFAETLAKNGDRDISIIQDESVDSSGHVDLLISTQRQNRANLRGVGIASEAFLRNAETDERTAAIIIDVELDSGFTSRTATLWHKNPADEIEFQPTVQQSLKPRIWT